MKTIICMLMCLIAMPRAEAEDIDQASIVEIDGLLGGKISANNYLVISWKTIREGGLKVGQHIAIEGMFDNDPYMGGESTILGLWDKDTLDKILSGKREDPLLLHIPLVYQRILLKGFRLRDRVRIFGVYLQGGDRGQLIRIDAVQKIEVPK